MQRDVRVKMDIPTAYPGPDTPDSLSYILLGAHLRKLLGGEAGAYYLLHWVAPVDGLPENGSYILIKFLDEDGKTVCSCPASYEGGQFRDLQIEDLDLVINPAVILGWTYYPYDDRLPRLL